MEQHSKPRSLKLASKRATSLHPAPVHEIYIYTYIHVSLSLSIYIDIYTSVDPCITCTEQAVEMLLVSKLVEAISFSKLRSMVGSFVFSFVGSRSGLPEIPVATGSLSEVPVAPGAAVLRPHWLPERPF